MRVAILGGGGAMGGLIGAALHGSGGAEVTLVDVARPAVEAINRDGLLVEGKDGSTRRVAVPATTDPAGVGPVDLVVNFVKRHHTEAAVTAARPMPGPATTVLTLLNGWGNAARIAGLVGRERALVGLTCRPGTLVAPGHVKHPGAGMAYLGRLDGRASERLRAVADLFRAAGLEVAASAAIGDEVWKKLAPNACTLPTSALLRFRAHQPVARGGTKVPMAAILREVVAVAGRKGIALDQEERWSAITGLLARAGRRPGVDAAGRRGPAPDRDRGDQRGRGRRGPRGRGADAVQRGHGLARAPARGSLPRRAGLTRA